MRLCKTTLLCREVSGHGAERSHYQPNRVRNSVVRNESAEPGFILAERVLLWLGIFGWLSGFLLLSSLYLWFVQYISFSICFRRYKG